MNVRGLFGPGALGEQGSRVDFQHECRADAKDTSRDQKGQKIFSERYEALLLVRQSLSRGSCVSRAGGGTGCLMEFCVWVIRIRDLRHGTFSLRCQGITVSEVITKGNSKRRCTHVQKCVLCTVFCHLGKVSAGKLHQSVSSVSVHQVQPHRVQERVPRTVEFKLVLKAVRQPICSHFGPSEQVQVFSLHVCPDDPPWRLPAQAGHRSSRARVRSVLAAGRCQHERPLSSHRRHAHPSESQTPVVTGPLPLCLGQWRVTTCSKIGFA